MNNNPHIGIPVLSGVFSATIIITFKPSAIATGRTGDLTLLINDAIKEAISDNGVVSCHLQVLDYPNDNKGV